MTPTRTLSSFLNLIAFSLLLTACNSVSLEEAQSVDKAPTGTVVFKYVDCIWSGVAQVWIDEDEDGVWDSGEQPAEGIQFWVDDAYNEYSKVGGGISDTTGEADISVWMPGCPTVELVVYPELPS